MVSRRSNQSKINSGSESDISGESDQSDSRFNNLIDDIIGQISSCTLASTSNMTIKNKNRKERGKPDKTDRPTDHESPGTSSNSHYDFNYQPYMYGARGERTEEFPNIYMPRPHGNQRQDSSSAKDREQLYHQYGPSNSQKRHWPPQAIHDGVKKSCDRRNNSLIPGDNAQGTDGSANREDSGNNSEDEYYIATGTRLVSHSKSEDNALEGLLMEKKGWKIVHVGSDGACLFRSVAHQIFGDEEKHHVIRKQVLDYMTKNKEHFSQYITEDFARYVERKKDLRCHGNHVEIQAIAELYNRPVEIYHSSVEPINVFQAEYSNEPPIRLSYHGRVHYNSVVDPFNPTFGHGLGMPNYQPGLSEPDLIARAVEQSENAQIEEAMLRDKLSETEQQEIDQCIEDQVVRESYFEHISNFKRAGYRAGSQSRQSLSPRPVCAASAAAGPSLPSSSSAAAASTAAAATPAASSSSSSSSRFAQPAPRDASAGAGAAAAAVQGASPSTSAQQQSSLDSALLRHIPSDMLDMDEDAVLAMVLEQSREEYVDSLQRKRTSCSSASVSSSMGFLDAGRSGSSGCTADVATDDAHGVETPPVEPARATGNITFTEEALSLPAATTKVPLVTAVPNVDNHELRTTHLDIRVEEQFTTDAKS